MLIFEKVFGKAGLSPTVQRDMLPWLGGVTGAG
jgi:hypothetical protein